MPSRRLGADTRALLKHLGAKIRRIILEELGYKSLDAFSLEHHEQVTKPTLYEVCDGKRDMKISTLMGLAAALDTTIQELLDDIKK